MRLLTVALFLASCWLAWKGASDLRVARTLARSVQQTLTVVPCGPIGDIQL